MIEANGISWNIGGAQILNDISVSVGAGELLGDLTEDRVDLLEVGRIARNLRLDEELLQSLQELMKRPCGLESTGEIDVTTVLDRQFVFGHRSS